MMPSVSYNFPAYSSGDYFRGPTWLNIDYPAIIGLKKYGYIHLAEGYRERILDMCAEERRDLFEYYDSRTGEGRGASGYGWTAAFIIRFILNED
jgi:glycogen debranching enzyme